MLAEQHAAAGRALRGETVEPNPPKPELSNGPNDEPERVRLPLKPKEMC